jgi:SAM-dependent methyltransferase
MHLGIEIRTAVKKLLGPHLASYARRYLRQRVPEINSLLAQFNGQHALEIGGPSPLFSEDGSLPVYGVCRQVDNCLFSSKTIWGGNRADETPFYFGRKKRPGTQMICEGTELRRIEDETYDCVLASHCLEHMANPIKALLEWKRVLRRDGILLLVLPHKDGTFDRRRPTTSLAHMVEDFRRDTREDDLTHLPEILELHDLEMDAQAGTIEQFRRRCEENLLHRAIHHHVFDTATALATVDYARFQLSRVEFLKPHHIVIVAQRSEAPPDNMEFLQIGAECRRRSPFSSDRILPPGARGDFFQLVI